MAAFWEGLVCGLHNADNREFAQSGDTSVFPLLFTVEDVRLLIVRADGLMQDSWHSIPTRRCYKTRLDISRDPELWLLGLGPELRNLCWLLHHLKASKPHCSSFDRPSLPVSATTDTSSPFHRIDDRKSSNPRMRGFLHGSSIIWNERGLRGFFQGFFPTTARQAANSATRFSSYITLKQFAQGYVAPGEKLGTASTFGIGGLAGLITV